MILINVCGKNLARTIAGRMTIRRLLPPRGVVSGVAGGEGMQDSAIGGTAANVAIPVLVGRSATATC